MYPYLKLSEQLLIPTFYLVISLTASFLALWVVYRARSKNLPVSDALDIGLALLVGGFLGARLFHVLYEEPQFYFAHPMEILKLWHGGYVFYGGVFGALALGSLLLWYKQKKLGNTGFASTFWPWADFFAPIVALGYALGRIGCFLNGCCFGHPSSLPWALTFPSHSHWGMSLSSRHPTQLYAFVWEMLLVGALLWWDRRGSKLTSSPPIPGQLFLLWLAGHSLGRILMELFRDDFRGPQMLGGILSISSLISLVLLGTALALLWGLFREKRA